MDGRKEGRKEGRMEGCQKKETMDACMDELMAR